MTILTRDPSWQDSNICAAAIHAGIVLNENGGDCTLLKAPGQDFYTGSTRNGITSREYVAEFPQINHPSIELLLSFSLLDFDSLFWGVAFFFRFDGNFEVSFTFADGGELTCLQSYKLRIFPLVSF